MSAREELEKLQAMRAELEAESSLLKERQNELEGDVLSLEEKVVIEELKKEKAAIEELKNRNKTAKNAITELETKKKKLENKLEQVAETKEAPSRNKKAKEAAALTEETFEETEEGGVTILAIEGEALIENQEIVSDSSSKQDKKRRRFF